MFKNKLARHTSTFFMIVLASVLLFPAIKSLSAPVVWVLLVVVIIANLINLLIA